MTHDDRLFLCCQVHGKVHGSRRQSKYTNIGRHLTKNAMIARMSKFGAFFDRWDCEWICYVMYSVLEKRGMDGWESAMDL